ncbi:Hypothetical protein A7982_10860 [Minicystis rosea]|nr:Hypothetical protein A7982_10860 [Minicystis rosea]
MLAASALWPSRASAGTPEDEKKSRQFFAEADSLANQGRWKDACVLFQAAHDLNSTNGTAYRTAECYEHVGDDDRAVRLYQYVLDHRATDQVPERVMLAEKHVQDLKEKAARAKAAVGQQKKVEQAPPPPPPPPKPNRVPAIVAFTVGGLGAVVGGVFGGMALSQASDIKSKCGPDPARCPGFATKADYDSAVGAVQTKAWVSNVTLGVAVVGVVTGSVLYALGYPKAATKVTSAVGPSGLTLSF